jgi:hypothetical protein
MFSWRFSRNISVWFIGTATRANFAGVGRRSRGKRVVGHVAADHHIEICAISLSFCSGHAIGRCVLFQYYLMTAARRHTTFPANFPLLSCYFFPPSHYFCVEAPVSTRPDYGYAPALFKRVGRPAIFPNEIVRIAETLKKISLGQQPNALQTIGAKAVRESLMSFFSKDIRVVKLHPPKKR